MIMISFRTKRDKDDMIYKAKEMEKFAREFVECLERGEENYDERYGERGRYGMRDDYEEGRMHDEERMRGRYGYMR